MPDITLFLIAAMVVTIAPGPDNVYVLTRGITQGRKAGFAAALGFASGCLFHTALAALGVAALIKSSPFAFAVVKYAGAAYLVYIGIRTLMAAYQSVKRSTRGSSEGIALNTHQSHLSLITIYKQSVVGNMLNPKVTLFFLSFLPQFVNANSGNIAWQLALLGVLFMAQTIVIFGAIALASGLIGDRLRQSPKLANWLDWIAGFTFIALGIKVAWPDSRIA
jgi:threonine/homoserine/homoserine lactone efflux protein